MTERDKELLRLREVLRAAKAVIEQCEPYWLPGLKADTLPLAIDRFGWLRDAVRDADNASSTEQK